MFMDLELSTTKYSEYTRLSNMRPWTFISPEKNPPWTRVLDIYFLQYFSKALVFYSLKSENSIGT